MRAYGWVTLSLLFACGEKPRSTRETPAQEAAQPAPSAAGAATANAAVPSASSSAAISGEVSAPVLAAEGPFVTLAVKGFGDSVLSVPIGATTKRPVVVAVHGNYNRPESLCEAWRTIVGERVFVLCPRGVLRKDSPAPPDQRFTFDDVASLEREIDAGLEALHARYGAFVDEGPMLYAGFSLGAIMAPFVVAHSPARFPRAVLVEGGSDRWVPDALDAFAKGGGQRVLFVCAQPECASDAAFANARLDAAGIKAEAVIGVPVGHKYDGAVAETTRGALAWLLEGDTRFGTFP